MAIACACTMTLSAQEPDLEAIAKARKVKADSLVTMMAKVYATQAAMNHPGSEARATLLKAFDESFNLEKQDETSSSRKATVLPPSSSSKPRA